MKDADKSARNRALKEVVCEGSDWLQQVYDAPTPTGALRVALEGVVCEWDAGQGKVLRGQDLPVDAIAYAVSAAIAALRRYARVVKKVG